MQKSPTLPSRIVRSLRPRAGARSVTPALLLALSLITMSGCGTTPGRPASQNPYRAIPADLRSVSSAPILLPQRPPVATAGDVPAVLVRPTQVGPRDLLRNERENAELCTADRLQLDKLVRLIDALERDWDLGHE